MHTVMVDVSEFAYLVLSHSSLVSTYVNLHPITHVYIIIISSHPYVPLPLSRLAVFGHCRMRCNWLDFRHSRLLGRCINRVLSFRFAAVTAFIIILFPNTFFECSTWLSHLLKKWFNMKTLTIYIRVDQQQLQFINYIHFLGCIFWKLSRVFFLFLSRLTWNTSVAAGDRTGCRRTNDRVQNAATIDFRIRRCRVHWRWG